MINLTQIDSLSHMCTIIPETENIVVGRGERVWVLSSRLCWLREHFLGLGGVQHRYQSDLKRQTSSSEITVSALTATEHHTSSSFLAVNSLHIHTNTSPPRYIDRDQRKANKKDQQEKNRIRRAVYFFLVAKFIRENKKQKKKNSRTFIFLFDWMN